MQDDSGIQHTELRVDGGGCRNHGRNLLAVGGLRSEIEPTIFAAEGERLHGRWHMALDRAKAWHDEWRPGEVRSPKPQLLGGLEDGASWA